MLDQLKKKKALEKLSNWDDAYNSSNNMQFEIAPELSSGRYYGDMYLTAETNSDHFNRVELPALKRVFETPNDFNDYSDKALVKLEEKKKAREDVRLQNVTDPSDKALPPYTQYMELEDADKKNKLLRELYPRLKS